MRTRSLLTAVALCGGLLFAGCGEDDQSAGGGDGGAAAAAPGGDTVRIPIRNIEYQPEEQRVKVGQTVEWVNEDSVPHNVVDNGDAFASEDLAKGSTFTYKATEAGTFEYVCTIHPGQTGKLIVEG